jgi:hypothetical protein
MIFPNCEKLGQTIIFVATKNTSRQLHMQLKTMGFKITSIQVRMGGRVVGRVGRLWGGRVGYILDARAVWPCCCWVSRAAFWTVFCMNRSSYLVRLWP